MSQKTQSLPRGLCEKQDELNPVNFWEDHQYIYILNLQWLRKKNYPTNKTDVCDIDDTWSMDLSDLSDYSSKKPKL